MAVRHKTWRCCTVFRALSVSRIHLGSMRGTLTTRWRWALCSSGPLLQHCPPLHMTSPLSRRFTWLWWCWIVWLLHRAWACDGVASRSACSSSVSWVHEDDKKVVFLHMTSLILGCHFLAGLRRILYRS
ncbi:hypothetical protein B0O80DRAFT_462642 [Mortierella sp. GBAus27b]|nr:hypothetical protein B0O80DRAFT_462642 [Mortierella sp. GBAus27b]